MIATPALLCSLRQLSDNLKQMQEHCRRHQLNLRPMVKTHKCSRIIQMQMEAGATGVLTTSLKEARLALKTGCKDITLAYPLMEASQKRALQEMSENCKLTLTVDSLEQVEFLQSCFMGMPQVKILIKIDSGLHRLGIIPEDTPRLQSVCQAILQSKNLEYEGVSTHAGQVYSCRNLKEVLQVAKKEQDSVRRASKSLLPLSPSNVVAIGSTPTVICSNDFEGITEVRPGNYVFYDRIQVALGAAQMEQCALRVAGTVLSKPADHRAIINLGSKQLGLDRGAHGQELTPFFGTIMEYPEAEIFALSEELGRVCLPLSSKIQAGDIIHVIPNHACVVSNLFRKMHLIDSFGKVLDTWEIDSGN